MKISIITTTYNSGATLRDTIKSVLRQSYKDIEYLIVDGASKDNTLDVVREYEPRFAGKMHYVSEQDSGIYDAMNKGIRMATGDVVGILNSDDFYTSDKVLENVARNMMDNNLDAIYGDVHYVKGEDLTKCVRYYSSKNFSRQWMRFGFMPAHPSFYCRRKIYNTYGLFNTSYCVAADFEILLRFIFVNRIKTKYIPIDFVTMRIGGISSSGLQSHKRIMHDHLRALHSNRIYSNIVILLMRYPYKVLEITLMRMKNQTSSLCCKCMRMSFPKYSRQFFIHRST